MRILFPLIALAAGVAPLPAQNPLWIDLSGEWRISTSDKPGYAGAGPLLLLVGHISGALSNERKRQPAEVLVNLNESLIGRPSGGFVTCCCVLFAQDGSDTVANAGHPAPYAGGRELAIEAGLPLGVVSGSRYTDVSFALKCGEPFTMISDGVLEAAIAKGELFGFDRARKISGGRATEIVDAARAWRQNDDITVVTVRRAEARRVA